jgi:MFS family permease
VYRYQLDPGETDTDHSLFSPFIYAPVLASTNSLPPNLAAYAVAMLQAGSTTGRVSAGIIGDRFGVWPTYLFACCGAVITLAAFWIGDTRTPGTIIGLVGYGHFSGMLITMMGGCCASITAASGSMDQLGLRLGLIFGVMSVPNLLGPVICGCESDPALHIRLGVLMIDIINVTPGERFTYSGVFALCTMFIGSCVSLTPWVWSRLRERKVS